MKPTPKVFANRLVPLRNKFSVFATTPSTSSRFPAPLVRCASLRSRTPAVMLFNASRGLSHSREAFAIWGLFIIFARPQHSARHADTAVASNVSLVRFVPVISRFPAYAVSLLAVAFLISACASRDESVIQESTAAPSAPMFGRPVYTPGAEGMSASHELGSGGSGGSGATPY